VDAGAAELRRREPFAEDHRGGANGDFGKVAAGRTPAGFTLHKRHFNAVSPDGVSNPPCACRPTGCIIVAKKLSGQHVNR
jgi:hypothetical protein